MMVLRQLMGKSTLQSQLARLIRDGMMWMLSGRC